MQAQSTYEGRDAVTVVIPALNEALTIGDIIERTRPYTSDILVVDGHSPDGTAGIAGSMGARVVFDHGKGKGEAIRSVIPHLDREITVFIDADGSHDPDDIPNLIRPILEGRADHVSGSRLIGGSSELHGGFDECFPPDGKFADHGLHQPPFSCLPFGESERLQGDPDGGPPGSGSEGKHHDDRTGDDHQDPEEGLPDGRGPLPRTQTKGGVLQNQHPEGRLPLRLHHDQVPLFLKCPDFLLFNPPAPGGRGYTREGRCTQEAGVWGTQWPPLTFATAAALLRRDDHRVTLRDYPATGADLLSLQKDLRMLRPGFAIWSTGTPTLSSDLDIARIVRENSPESITAVIGTHVTVRPEEALCEPALDVVVRGEPEGIIRELCRCGGGWAQVPGISWRDNDGTIRRNPDAPWLDPDAIPAPDWDGLDRDAYRLPLKGRRFLMTAPVRGCPYHCTFCTAPLYYGHRLRRRPVAQVIDEMAASVSRYGIREFFIWADTFTADRRYVQELCRFILDKGLRISWTCNSRVDTIDEETLRLMKQAGLWMISFGLESGNDAILAASGKGITAAQSCAGRADGRRTRDSDGRALHVRPSGRNGGDDGPDAGPGPVAAARYRPVLCGDPVSRNGAVR